MRAKDNTYQPNAKRGLAIMFLFLFLNGFVTETIAFHLNDICQSEIVDFENDKDSEEDNKNEKEKENKILNFIELPRQLNEKLASNGAPYAAGLNDQIQEVLSPPPECG